MTDPITTVPLGDAFAELVRTGARLHEQTEAERADAAMRRRAEAWERTVNQANAQVAAAFPDHAVAVEWHTDIDDDDSFGDDRKRAVSQSFEYATDVLRFVFYPYSDHHSAHLELEHQCATCAEWIAFRNPDDGRYARHYVHNAADAFSALGKRNDHEPWQCEVNKATARGVDLEEALERFAPPTPAATPRPTGPAYRTLAVGGWEERLLDALSHMVRATAPGPVE